MQYLVGHDCSESQLLRNLFEPRPEVLHFLVISYVGHVAPQVMAVSLGEDTPLASHRVISVFGDQMVYHLNYQDYTRQDQVAVELVLLFSRL